METNCSEVTLFKKWVLSIFSIVFLLSIKKIWNIWYDYNMEFREPATSSCKQQNGITVLDTEVLLNIFPSFVTTSWNKKENCLLIECSGNWFVPGIWSYLPGWKYVGRTISRHKKTKYEFANRITALS